MFSAFTNSSKKPRKVRWCVKGSLNMGARGVFQNMSKWQALGTQDAIKTQLSLPHLTLQSCILKNKCFTRMAGNKVWHPLPHWGKIEFLLGHKVPQQYTNYLTSNHHLKVINHYWTWDAVFFNRTKTTRTTNSTNANACRSQISSASLTPCYIMLAMKLYITKRHACCLASTAQLRHRHQTNVDI